jgi:hypothetical protein
MSTRAELAGARLFEQADRDETMSRSNSLRICFSGGEWPWIPDCSGMTKSGGDAQMGGNSKTSNKGGFVF